MISDVKGKAAIPQLMAQKLDGILIPAHLRLTGADEWVVVSFHGML
jgi:hypothetical protein